MSTACWLGVAFGGLIALLGALAILAVWLKRSWVAKGITTADATPQGPLQAIVDAILKLVKAMPAKYRPPLVVAALGAVLVLGVVAGCALKDDNNDNGTTSTSVTTTT